MIQGNGANGSNGANREWCLARTRSLSEYKAATALEKSGHELYFPRVNTPRPRSGHTDAPLFPGYLFVRVDRNGGGLPPVQHISGLLGWVRFDGVVPTLPADLIADLDRRVREINSQGGHWRRYQPGERVQVSSGKVQSLAEVLEEPKSPQSRVRVLLHFMGRIVPARVPWHDLEPAADVDAAVGRNRPPRRTRGKGRWINGFGPRTTVNATTPGT